MAHASSVISNFVKCSIFSLLMNGITFFGHILLKKLSKFQKCMYIFAIFFIVYKLLLI